jgi:yecA family protein
MENSLPLNGSMNGSIDLDTLDDYLMSNHAPDDSMGLSDLDGFLTGIAVGPELILPSEWLPVIWGGDKPVFDTESEMRAVLGAIMGRYNEIVACINAMNQDFQGAGGLPRPVERSDCTDSSVTTEFCYPLRREKTP